MNGQDINVKDPESLREVEISKAASTTLSVYLVNGLHHRFWERPTVADTGHATIADNIKANKTKWLLTRFEKLHEPFINSEALHFFEECSRNKTFITPRLATTLPDRHGQEPGEHFTRTPFWWTQVKSRLEFNILSTD